MKPETGQRLTAEKTFNEADVRAFAELIGDKGRHHMVPDAKGRLMVHGLHTASVPTRLGGEINYIAREMLFEYVRPVFTGDTVTAELVLTEVTEDERQYNLKMDVVVKNQHGKEVIKGMSNGIILKVQS